MLIVELLLILIFMAFFYILIQNNFIKKPDRKSSAVYAVEKSLNLLLRTLVSMKPPIVMLESQGYKIALISVTTLGSE